MKKDKNNILLYMLKMLLVFIAIDLILMIFSYLVSNVFTSYKYGADLLYELFYALFILIIMLVYKNSYVFTQKNVRFAKGLKYGIPILVLSGVILVSNVITLKELSIPRFTNLVLLTIFIGVAEEFLCRGWLQNEFIERFSKDKKMVIKSIVISSFVFGFMHILNISSQTVFETILQIINATALGFLLGSIYYKTKNIWVCIFLHAFYDFAIMIGDMNLIKDCTYNSPTTAITIVNGINIIFFCFLWIFSAINVLDKSDFPGEKKSPEKTNPYVRMIICVSFIMVFVPFENLVHEYNEYRVCYKYEEKKIDGNYAVHFPYYEEYLIEGANEDVKSIDNQKVINIDNYSYQFYIKKGKVYLKNNNTGYEVKTNYKDLASIVVINNNDNYILLVYTLENEATIYYSDYMNINNFSNEDEYLDSINRSFKKYEFPSLASVGYVTFENNETKYPVMVSQNKNVFMIEDRRLFLLSKESKDEKDN